MKSILPEVLDRDHYQVLFKENHHWEEAILFIQKQYQLNGPIRRGNLGSHIVYRVGDTWVKLMAPLFAKDMPFEISGLKAVEGRLQVSTPEILGQGVLDGWAYVLLSHVPGEAIRHVWPSFSMDQKLVLADQMAEVVKRISLCPADEVIANRFHWNDFIANQYQNCESQQKAKGLPEPWLRSAAEFLHSISLQDFQTDQPVFLHADLTYDHFLVSQEIEGAPRISGLIDMADCQLGHFEYELIAPCIFLFKGQKDLLRRFLHTCGYAKDHLDQQFAEKLLAWSMLHRYFSFISYFQEDMKVCSPGDFSALAKQVFPL